MKWEAGREGEKVKESAGFKLHSTDTDINT